MYKVEMYLRVRRACFVEGMSAREAARVYGLHRDTVRKMLKYSVPPGYRRERPPSRPKLDPYKGVIDQILEHDQGLPKKQRHCCQSATMGQIGTRENYCYGEATLSFLTVRL